MSQYRSANEMNALRPSVGSSRPCGSQQITNLSSATGLTLTDAEAEWAVISVGGQSVRYLESAAPTPTVGILLTPGIYQTVGDLSTIKFIETAASATLDIQ